MSERGALYVYLSRGGSIGRVPKFGLTDKIARYRSLDFIVAYNAEFQAAR